jgi:hypothetical protein
MEEQIRTWPPEQLHKWIVRLKSGDEPIPQEFNWAALAEYVDDRLFHSADQGVVDKKWLVPAVAVHDFIVTLSTDHYERESREVASMMIRAKAMRLVGLVPGDPVLDGEIIRDWFEQSLGISLDEARSKVREWRTMTASQREGVLLEEREVLRRLRRVKNRLAVIEELARAPTFVADDRLRAWLAARDELP